MIMCDYLCFVFKQSARCLLGVVVCLVAQVHIFADDEALISAVDPAKSLMITDLRVIEDPVRTNPANGKEAVWTFKYLMEQMSGKQDPSDFTRSLFSFAETDPVNGISVPPRGNVFPLILDPWPKLKNGKLDLAQAPMKLLAIVNRPDLRIVRNGRVEQAGEGRFIFGVMTPDGKPLPAVAGGAATGMTFILEYALPARRQKHVDRWAEDWAELSQYDLDNPNDLEDYLDDLEDITRGFADGGRRGKWGKIKRKRPNKSALNQIRSNDIALNSFWELREWIIDSNTGLLKPEQVDQTPDFIEFNGTQALADLINDNESDILSGIFDLPKELESGYSPSGPFVLAGPSFINQRLETVGDEPFKFVADDPVVLDVNGNPLGRFLQGTRTWTVTGLGPAGPRSAVANIPWSAAGISNNDARHAFGLNTCAGCHRDETGLGFLQVGFPLRCR